VALHESAAKLNAVSILIPWSNRSYSHSKGLGSNPEYGLIWGFLQSIPLNSATLPLQVPRPVSLPFQFKCTRLQSLFTVISLDPRNTRKVMQIWRQAPKVLELSACRPVLSFNLHSRSQWHSFLAANIIYNSRNMGYGLRNGSPGAHTFLARTSVHAHSGRQIDFSSSHTQRVSNSN
jgi:hypothetical protein